MSGLSYGQSLTGLGRSSKWAYYFMLQQQQQQAAAAAAAQQAAVAAAAAKKAADLEAQLTLLRQQQEKQSPAPSFWAGGWGWGRGGRRARRRWRRSLGLPFPHGGSNWQLANWKANEARRIEDSIRNVQHQINQISGKPGTDSFVTHLKGQVVILKASLAKLLAAPIVQAPIEPGADTAVSDAAADTAQDAVAAADDATVAADSTVAAADATTGTTSTTATTTPAPADTLVDTTATTPATTTTPELTPAAVLGENWRRYYQNKIRELLRQVDYFERTQPGSAHLTKMQGLLKKYQDALSSSTPGISGLGFSMPGGFSPWTIGVALVAGYFTICPPGVKKRKKIFGF